MKKILLLLAGAVMLLGLLLAVAQQARRSAERTRLATAELAAKRAAVESKLAQRPLPAPLATAGAASHGKPLPPALRQWEAIKADPDLMALYRKTVRADAMHRYGALFRAAKLSPDQILAFEDAVFKSQIASSDLMAAAAASGVNPRTDPATRAALQQQQTQLVSDESEILGPDAAQDFQEMQRTAASQNFAMGVAEGAIWSGAPLTAAQVDQVAALVSNASAAYLAGGNTDIISADLGAVYQKAQAVLTPEQLAALQGSIQTAGFQQKEKQFFQQTGMIPPSTAKTP